MSSDPDTEARPTPGRPSLRSLTGRQRAILALVLLAVPVVLFGLLEVGLRIAGYGSGYPLFVPVEATEGYQVPNPEVARRYFRYEAGMPIPAADLFRTTKTDDIYRIVVQGASTVAGFPYRHGAAFPRMLEQRLQETFPDRTIEVVNTALDATNSYTLLDLADDIVAIQPDAVLLYAGHNEYYGVLGAASSESVGRVPGMIHLYLGLRRLRTVQLLEKAAEGVAGLYWRVRGRPDVQPRTLMEYLASDHDVPFRSSRYEDGVQQFQRNMSALVDRYRDAGIPVYIGTVASNLRDLEPFMGGPGPDTDTAAWNSALADARNAFARGDTGTGGTAIRRMLALDSTAALPYYLRGRLLEQDGDTAAARDAYVAARDRDRLPFRAPSPINEIIGTLAERPGVHRVDTGEALAAASPGDTPDGTIFLEHVHPTVEGQLLLADAFYHALQDEGAIGAWDREVSLDSARARALVTVVDSVAGAYTVQQLTAGFPFHSPADVEAPRTGGAIQGIASAYHQGRIPWTDAMQALEAEYARRSDWTHVAHVDRALAQEIGYSVQPLLRAAQAALLADHDAAASRDLAEARRRLPTARGEWLQGNILARAGDTAAARTAYRRARELNARGRLAPVALQALDTLPALEAEVRARPDDPDARAALAAAYFAIGRYQEAAEAADRVLRSHPGHSLASQVLRQWQSITGTPPSSAPRR